ncbi:hypothetical protein ACBY01_13350 [Sphingomonas sp. ac-8]|uniref:hypothetical protein n=1 Tax=Sphingomonas sp. ac-8 TaxID=3242977 RepID=UPI003A80C326
MEFAPQRRAVAHASEATAAVGAATLLREQIAEAYALANAATAFTTSEHSAADLRQLLRERVDANVLDGARALRGSDHRFSPADGKPRHAGVIEIRYADARVAAARVRPLLGERRFFRGTQILTPMVAAAHGDTVVLFFTESAGDAKLRATLAAAAARLRDR